VALPARFTVIPTIPDVPGSPIRPLLESRNHRLAWQTRLVRELGEVCRARLGPFAVVVMSAAEPVRVRRRPQQRLAASGVASLLPILLPILFPILAAALAGSGCSPGPSAKGGTGGIAMMSGGTGGGALSEMDGSSDGNDPDATGGGGSDGRPAQGKPLAQLQREFVDLRFGMFIHFGILTYAGVWSQPNLPIERFNPTLLNPAQWADAALSAHMKFGLLTTRHHDGFALWPSAAGTFNVKSIPWKNGQGDVVKEYVDAFRAKGLLPGLYYSVWDNTQGIGNGPVTPAQLDYVKTQITELLTNYGPIPILVFDGWSWKPGHKAVAYQEIRELVKSLQPNCLLTDHTHLADPWEVDIVNFEEPTAQFAPPDNTYAAEQDTKINASGGNDWFWAPSIGGLMSVSTVVDGHLKLLEPRWTNFILNCPPNRDGLLDAAIVTRLAEVGAAWSPDLARPPLPAQPPPIDHPYTALSATATSGVALDAIDGKNNSNNYTAWRSAGALPQSITVDLGVVRPDVGMLAYVPGYTNLKGGTGDTTGAITEYTILVGTDETTFTTVATGTWAGDGKMKVATFAPAAARFVRLKADAVGAGASAVATELTIGANR
jgi:alpha-L-fucosidase